MSAVRAIQTSLPARLLPAAAALLLGLGLLSGLGGCAANPATGEQSFVGLLPPEEEADVGAAQHPRILEAYGGAYDDPEIAAYVDRIGQRLAAVAERPDLAFTFTVLDSEIVNAFALPGGYIYVSRGLMTLAENEAQLASVIGHEIGHVAALHSAQRMSRGLVAGLLAGVAGAVVGDPDAARLFNLGANAVVQSYSREQELEADMLGIRYMTRVGYDPRASADFLAKLRDQSRLQARMLGGSDPDRFDLFASHPRTLVRVREAAATAATGGGRLDRDGYLARIDGMIYGGSPRQGFVRGRDFVHPELRFAFTVPDGFVLMNSAEAVRAIHRSRGAGILFDMARSQTGGGPAGYLRSQWAPGARWATFDRLTIAGRAAATGLILVNDGRGSRDVRLLAIDAGDGRVYRFVFVNRTADRARFEDGFQRTAFGFQTLTAEAAARLRPDRIRIVRVAPSDTVAGLARGMPEGPFPEERFRLLNGLAPGERPVPGSLVKVIER